MLRSLRLSNSVAIAWVLLVLCTGAGVARAQTAVLSVTSGYMGQLLIGSSATANVVLSNTGTAALSISSIVASGPPFTQTNTCGTSVAAGGKCTIAIKFTPTVNGLVSGTVTVTITMHALPPGKYAVILGQAAGAPLGGQIGLIAVWDPTATPAAWKLGGVSVRQGIVDGHDGVWYWSRARSQAATGQPWSAWYSYELARYLLLPVDFLTSPNLEKLEHEQSEIKNPPGGFPISVSDGPRTWRIDGMRIDTTLRQADLSVTYESLGIADPAAERTEATAVLSAMLKAHPELKDNFHGMWAVASKDGKLTPVMELPMGQIP